MAEQEYDKARGLAEQALKEFAAGNEEAAAKLTEQAKAIDPQAVQDVADELEEDAGSEHDPAKIREDLGNDADKQ